jgi:hypothetical protein
LFFITFTKTTKIKVRNGFEITFLGFTTTAFSLGLILI